MFTARVRGTRSWDVPAPVSGWVARDVVRHLAEWLPAFLAGGSTVRLPAIPSVDDDPDTGELTPVAAHPETGAGPSPQWTDAGHFERAVDLWQLDNPP